MGQTNFLTPNRESLNSLQDWLMQFHVYWGSDKETLENHARYLGAQQPGKREATNKYVFLYKGFVTPTKEIGEAWGAWFASITEHIVNASNPFGAAREITKDGTTDLPLDLDAFTGYTIINAANFDEATTIAGTCPFISGIRVYEAMAM